MKQFQTYYRLVWLLLLASLYLAIDAPLATAQPPAPGSPPLRLLSTLSGTHFSQTPPVAAEPITAIKAETLPQTSQVTPVRRSVGSDATWDDRFGRPGLRFNDINYNVGTLALAGNDLYVGGDFDGNIAHWNGRRWQDLGDGLNDDVYAVLAQGDDVYVGGFFNIAGQVQAGGVARWNGTNWSAVGTGVGVADGVFPIVYALAWQNEALYVGGRFGSVDGVPAGNIARWDGNAWSALGTGVSHSQYNAEIDSLLVHNGLLYVGGLFDQAGGSAANNIAVWDGADWSPLGTGVNATVYALATDGVDLYAGGEFQTAGGQVVDGIARWDGSAWHPLGSGLQRGSLGGRVWDLAVIGSSLYAVGDFDQAGPVATAGLARWRDGAWSAMWDGVTGSVIALTPSEDGGFYVAGDFDFIRPVSDLHLVFNIAKWRDGTWHTLGAGPIRDNPLGAGWIPGWTDVLAVDNQGDAFLDLSDTYVDGQPVSGPVRWDGQVWSPLATVDLSLTAIAIDGDLVYCSGNFTNLPGVGTVPMAIWNQDTQTWSTLSSQLSGTILALTVEQGILYAAGSFNVPGYSNTRNVAWWDGNQWSASTQTVNGQDFEIGNAILALAVVGGRVFVGGTFENLIFPNGVLPINNIVGLDVANDQWFGMLSPGGTTPGVTFAGDGASADVRALSKVGERLYVGGSFSQAGDLLSDDLAAWDTTQGWSSLGGGVGGMGPSWVETLAAAGTDLYVGGKFTAAGPQQVDHIARWDTVAGTWSSLAGGLGSDDDTLVYAIAAGGGSVYVSGDFAEAGGQPAYGFARWGPPALLPSHSFISANEGGSLTTGDGLAITFPAGAVADDIIVTYQALNAPTHTLPAERGAIRAFTLQAHDLDGMPVSTFLQPYTLILTYTEAELVDQAIREANLNLLYWDGAWQVMFPCSNCSIDLLANQLTVVADHFTEFAFVGTQQRVYLPLLVR